MGNELFGRSLLSLSAFLVFRVIGLAASSVTFMLKNMFVYPLTPSSALSF